MKKLSLLILMLISTSMAVNVERSTYHIVDENLQVYTKYVDVFYDNWAETINQMLNAYPSQTSYLETRVPDTFEIKKWGINRTAETLTIAIEGIYNNYIVQQGNTYKVGGKGFIDNICTDLPVESIPTIIQNFTSEVNLPYWYEIVSIPENSTGDFPNIYYEYNVTAEKNTLTESVYFEVKKGTDIISYCNDRAKMDNALRQGFMIKKKADSNASIYLIIAVFAVLVPSIMFIKKK